MDIRKLLTEFTTSRNNSGNIIAAFGYGSALFKQARYKLQKDHMTDIIFVVENPHLWHKENMRRYPNDYSFMGRIILKYFDLNSIKLSTGLTYQSHIEFMGRKFKYGVISKDRFMDAMQGEYNSFFIQGRFQKPVYTIFSTEEINDAIDINRDLALLIALLTLNKDNPTLTDLYQQICNLSYNGDIRMLFAENPNKVKNIVQGSFEYFLEIYGTSNQYFYTTKNSRIVINKNLIYEHLHLLPNALLEPLLKRDALPATPDNVSKCIEKKLSKINRRDSILQPLNGILTVGPVRAFNYFKEKVKKKTMK